MPWIAMKYKPVMHMLIYIYDTSFLGVQHMARRVVIAYAAGHLNDILWLEVDLSKWSAPDFSVMHMCFGIADDRPP